MATVAMSPGGGRSSRPRDSRHNLNVPSSLDVSALDAISIDAVGSPIALTRCSSATFRGGPGGLTPQSMWAFTAHSSLLNAESPQLDAEPDLGRATTSLSPMPSNRLMRDTLPAVQSSGPGPSPGPGDDDASQRSTSSIATISTVGAGLDPRDDDLDNPSQLSQSLDALEGGESNSQSSLPTSATAALDASYKFTRVSSLTGPSMSPDNLFGSEFFDRAIKSEQPLKTVASYLPGNTGGDLTGRGSGSGSGSGSNGSNVNMNVGGIGVGVDIGGANGTLKGSPRRRKRPPSLPYGALDALRSIGGAGPSGPSPGGPTVDDLFVESPLVASLDTNRRRPGGTGNPSHSHSAGNPIDALTLGDPLSPLATSSYDDIGAPFAGAGVGGMTKQPKRGSYSLSASSFQHFGRSTMTSPTNSNLLVSPTHGHGMLHKRGRDPASPSRRMKRGDNPQKRVKRSTSAGQANHRSPARTAGARPRVGMAVPVNVGHAAGRRRKGTLNGGGVGRRGGRSRSRSNSLSKGTGGGTMGGHGVGRVPLPLLTEEQIARLATMEIRKGKWAPDEDAKLSALVDKWGNQEAWKHICLELGGRNTKQCRERWNNHLKPTLRHGAWSAEEDHIIETMRDKGAGWAEIAKRLVGRTDNKVKIRYHSIARRKAREQGEKKSKRKDPTI